MTSELDEDQVIEAVTSSPELQPIVQRILDTAARTNHEQTLRLLGAILGDSIGNRPRIDKDLLLVDGVTGLRPAHLRVLESLKQHKTTIPSSATSPEVIGTYLADELSDVAILAALGGLQARGMVQDPHPFGDGSRFEISPLGLAVLDVLRRA